MYTFPSLLVSYQAYLYRTKLIYSGTNFKSFNTKQQHRFWNTWNDHVSCQITGSEKTLNFECTLRFHAEQQILVQVLTNFYIWSFDWVPFVRSHWLLLTKNDWNPHKHTYLLDNSRSLWFIVWHRQILISIPLLGCFFGLELANG